VGIAEAKTADSKRTLELGKKSRKGLRSSAKYTSREKQAAGALHEWIWANRKLGTEIKTNRKRKMLQGNH
jgi:hypothetical protein